MGRSRGRLTTKIHALVDADGRPVRLSAHPRPGRRCAGCGRAPRGPPRPRGATLIADRAYDTNAIRDLAAKRGAWANIPPRSIRKGSFSFSTWVYRQRNLVERKRRPDRPAWIEKRRVWSAEEKRLICGQARLPGVSVSQVARRYDVNANLVFTWLRDPRFADTGGEETPFLPVEIVSPPELPPGPLSGEGRIEIELAGGHLLRVVGSYDPEALIRLLRGLSV